MIMDNRLILQAIADLSDRVEGRFDRVDDKFDALDDRTRKVEVDLTKIKTAGGIVATVLMFLGWEHVKPWLTALMKS
jgi:hypothetical protein